MGELGVLFNPGMRHEQEEKLAKQMLREDEGTGRKGRLGIDLESGVVVIGAGPAPSRQEEAPGESASAAGQRPTAEPKPTDTDAAESGDVRPGARRNGPANASSDGARREPAAAQSGKARRRSQPSAASHAPTGKARRGSR
jgi:hypothetical protein